MSVEPSHDPKRGCLLKPKSLFVVVGSFRILHRVLYFVAGTNRLLGLVAVVDSAHSLGAQSQPHSLWCAEWSPLVPVAPAAAHQTALCLQPLLGRGEHLSSAVQLMCNSRDTVHVINLARPYTRNPRSSDSQRLQCNSHWVRPIFCLGIATCCPKKNYITASVQYSLHQVVQEVCP